MQTESVIFACVVFCSIINQAFFYTEYLLESDKLCSIILNKKSIKLGYENKSGIIVRQEKLFNTMTGKYPFDCMFSVDGGSAGVVAVIQQMKFRTYITEDQNVSCIDYVQFSSGDKNLLSSLNIQFSNSREWSQKYCGEVDLVNNEGKNMPSTGNMMKTFFGSWETGQNTFMETKGSLDVKIHIGPYPSYETHDLALEMAFTSYQECKYNMGSYKMCGTTGGPICIWKEYFNDGVVNCPFLDCTDEHPCGVDLNDSKGIATGLGTKVLLGAVAGIFTMIFVLILFFWTFHYCNFLCGPKPPRNLTELASVPAGEEPVRRSPTCTTPLAPAQAEEKDLPPAYETLFPESGPGR